MNSVEKTLKITGVLSDPTRFHIYQYITKRHKDVTVQEIAEQFDIHPNVARLHLSKLEDVNMLKSETKKTGKGGRPSRLYRLSDDVIQLNFPYRDYERLARIAIETLSELGEVGKAALYETGRRFGKEMIEKEMGLRQGSDDFTFEEKLDLVKNAANTAGFYPELEVSDDKSKIFFHIYNCPFKEVAVEHKDTVCSTHFEFLKGMFETLFPDIKLEEKQNMFENGCESCIYRAVVPN